MLFFQHSTVRCSKLQTIQEALEKPILSVKEVHSVRWLAFLNVLTAVFHCWPSIAKTLGDDASDEGKGNARAKGLHKALTNFKRAVQQIIASMDEKNRHHLRFLMNTALYRNENMYVQFIVSIADVDKEKKVILSNRL